jgi:hypothetical protein
LKEIGEAKSALGSSEFRSDSKAASRAFSFSVFNDRLMSAAQKTCKIIPAHPPQKQKKPNSTVASRNIRKHNKMPLFESVRDSYFTPD